MLNIFGLFILFHFVFSCVDITWNDGIARASILAYIPVHWAEIRNKSMFWKKFMSWKKTCSFLGEWHLSCITINQRTLTTHSHYWQSYSDIVYIHMNRISFLLKCSTTAANSKCTQYISVGHVKAIIISLFFGVYWECSKTFIQ